MSSVKPGDKPKQARRRPVWVIVIGSILMIFLIVVLTFLGLVFLEFRKEIPPPRNTYSTAHLLVLNEPAAGQERREQTSGTQAMLKVNDPMTNRAQGGKPSITLKFKPFIPESANIPPELKAKAPEINKRFDQVYRHIEEYERIKGSQKPEDALTKVSQIATEYGNAVAEIWKALGKSMPAAAYEAITPRDQDFSRWFAAAEMDAYARSQKWGTAGSFAEGYLIGHRNEWIEQQLARHDGQPVHLSDFNRATGYEDYNRALYYFRRQDGMNGFMNTLRLYTMCKGQELADHFSAGLPQPGTGVRIITQYKK